MASVKLKHTYRWYAHDWNKEGRTIANTNSWLDSSHRNFGNMANLSRNHVLFLGDR